MRKILAVICTLITLYVIKETFLIFTSNNAEVVAQRPILIVIALSIGLPLILLSIWLWRPKNKKIEN
jgi:presenilin-like A22 family membrane protease